MHHWNLDNPELWDYVKKVARKQQDGKAGAQRRKERLAFEREKKEENSKRAVRQAEKAEKRKKWLSHCKLVKEPEECAKLSGKLLKQQLEAFRELVPKLVPREGEMKSVPLKRKALQRVVLYFNLDREAYSDAETEAEDEADEIGRAHV